MKNRNIFINIVREQNELDDLKYWLSKTPKERFTAAELLREQFYVINGYTKLPRIQKIISKRKLKGS